MRIKSQKSIIELTNVSKDFEEFKSVITSDESVKPHVLFALSAFEGILGKGDESKQSQLTDFMSLFHEYFQ